MDCINLLWSYCYCKLLGFLHQCRKKKLITINSAINRHEIDGGKEKKNDFQKSLLHLAMIRLMHKSLKCFHLRFSERKKKCSFCSAVSWIFSGWFVIFSVDFLFLKISQIFLSFAAIIFDQAVLYFAPCLVIC